MVKCSIERAVSPERKSTTMNAEHKKPTGTTEFWQIEIDKQASDKMVRLEFPKTKREIERLVIGVFCEANLEGDLNYLGTIHDQLPENDIDFHVDTPDGRIGFELVEDAPLNKGGYDGLKSEFSCGERFDHIVKLIEGKNQKYQNYNSTPRKGLLIYRTDDRLVLLPATHVLLLRYCHSSPMVFDFIYYMELRADSTPHLFSLFPWPDKEQLRRAFEHSEDFLRDQRYKKVI